MRYIPYTYEKTIMNLRLVMLKIQSHVVKIQLQVTHNCDICMIDIMSSDHQAWHGPWIILGIPQGVGVGEA